MSDILTGDNEGGRGETNHQGVALPSVSENKAIAEQSPIAGEPRQVIFPAGVEAELATMTEAQLHHFNMALARHLALREARAVKRRMVRDYTTRDTFYEEHPELCS